MHILPSHPVRALAAVVVALALLGLGPQTPSQARLPIEGYPSYQPQKRCSPSPKAGTLMLARYLVKRYPGTGSLGISRSCGASGISEHKEGRAFDWKLSAGSRRDRAYAGSFVGRLLATDRKGHANALARRMGIMYFIWNDHIWSASHGYHRRKYLHPACSSRRGCGTTLRHRDHMHVSLTRRAAHGKTSWYVHERRRRAEASATARAAARAAAQRVAKAHPRPRPAPKPAPKSQKPASATAKVRRLPPLPEGVVDLRRRPYRRITVRADGETVTTPWKVQAGVTYSLTAAGLYTYGTPRQVGDPACTWSAPRDGWVPRPGGRTRRTFGRLALSVNGKLPFGPECSSGSHVYRTPITPARDHALRLRLLGDHAGSSGRLTVVLSWQRTRVDSLLPAYPDLTPQPRSAEPPQGYGLVAERVTLPAAAVSRDTVGGLSPRARYRVTVRGAVGLGHNVRSNGQCVRIRRTWYRNASIDPRFPEQDHGNLYLNGVPFQGQSGRAGCGGNRHTQEVKPDRWGRIRFALWDPHDRSDNSGGLTIMVQRLTPIDPPGAGPKEGPRPRQAEWTQRRDAFFVNPAVRKGKTSTMRLRRGERVRVTVHGRMSSGGYAADASCVRTTAGWSTTLPDVIGSDPLNLWVDGQPVRWRALGTGSPCSRDNRYTTWFSATRHGPVNVALFDLDHRDNVGRFLVTLLRKSG